MYFFWSGYKFLLELSWINLILYFVKVSSVSLCISSGVMSCIFFSVFHLLVIFTRLVIVSESHQSSNL